MAQPVVSQSGALFCVGRTVDDEVKLAHEGFREGRARMRAHDRLPDMSVFEQRNTPTPRILAVAFDAVRKLERATQTRGARKSVRRRIAD